MKYYPVFLDLQNKPCLVVGGGAVGARKVDRLLSCGARVTVVTIAADERLHRLAAKNRIRLLIRPYCSSDLNGQWMVIGATNDASLNRRVSRDADALNMLCNIADRPACCNFILPSLVEQGDLVVAVSTSGQSPALAKKLRRELQQRFDPAYAVLLILLGAVRRKLLAAAHTPEAHKPLFEKLVNSDLLDAIRRQDTAAADAILKSVLGKEFDYASLMGAQESKGQPGFRPETASGVCR